MLGPPSSYNRNNDLLKGKKKLFYKSKQNLITFSSQAKEASRYFVVNNQLEKWAGFWLTQTNWVPFSGSLTPFLLFGGIMPTAHRGKELPRHFSGSEVTPHQFLTFGSKPDKANFSPSVCIGIRHAPALRNTKYRDGYSTKSLDPPICDLPRGHHKPEPLKLKASLKPLGTGVIQSVSIPWFSRKAQD